MENEAKTVTIGSAAEGASVVSEIAEKVSESIEKKQGEVEETADVVTEEEEFQILNGDAVEYTLAGGIKVHIKPLRIGQQKKMVSVRKLLSGIDVDEAAIEKLINVLSDYLGIEHEVFADNADLEDIQIISSIMLTVTQMGRKALSQKKTLSVSLQR